MDVAYGIAPTEGAPRPKKPALCSGEHTVPCAGHITDACTGSTGGCDFEIATVLSKVGPSHDDMLRRPYK